MDLYIPSMTDEELIRYADLYAETPLEKDLLIRIKAVIDGKNIFAMEIEDAYNDGYNDEKERAMPYNFDITINTGGWTIEVDNNAQYGYFEHNKTGTGGGLWFDERKVLIDYDGVFELPEPIISALKKHGYIVKEEEEEKRIL